MDVRLRPRGEVAETRCYASRVEVAEHTPLTPLPPSIVEVDERGARRTLRDQIGRLERELGQAVIDARPGVLGAPAEAPARGGPRVLSLGELERVRDRLADRLQDVRHELIARATEQAAWRELLERMLLAPGRYRHVRVRNADLGMPGCTTYESVPRLGLVGVLMGWWQVKVSSGCPLATGGAPALPL
ncbi:MAG: hypothetical protein JWN32_991 [Solirubrobacterales bacterium]|nr:hypothetical protein [Solirubrobacterales bacterium]